MMFNSQAHNQKMIDQLIDQEETVRVCHYCHIKVFMNDSANDGQEQLIADKQEIPVETKSEDEEHDTADVEEMAMWLGAGDAENQSKLKQMQLEINGTPVSSRTPKTEQQMLGSR